MTIDLSSPTGWLFTSFAGAAIVKLLDLVFSRIQDSRSLRQEKARTILAFLEEYGYLLALYRLQAHTSIQIARGEGGAFKTDKQGKFVMEKKVLEVEPRFDKALKSMKGADARSLTSQRIVSIRLAFPRAFDTALDLDPSGELGKRLEDVDSKTVFRIEFFRDHKDQQDWSTSLVNMVAALKEADEARRQAQAVLSKYLR